MLSELRLVTGNETVVDGKTETCWQMSQFRTAQIHGNTSVFNHNGTAPVTVQLGENGRCEDIRVLTTLEENTSCTFKQPCEQTEANSNGDRCMYWCVCQYDNCTFTVVNWSTPQVSLCEVEVRDN